MGERNLEQRIVIKFLVKLGKNGAETLEMLRKVYGGETMSEARVYEWHKRFREGREDVHDDKKTGRPLTSTTEENVEKIRVIVRQDRRMSIRLIAEQLNIDKETVRTILTERLGMRKVCSRMVPRILTDDQKQKRVEICSAVLEKIRTSPKFLDLVITGDETWVFQYDPETKRQSMQWQTPSSPRLKKARMSRSKIKSMLVAFFDCRGVVHHKFVPPNQTVNQTLYIEILRRLREKIRKTRPKLWPDKWFLHHDNAPCHSSLAVREFLTKNKITTLEHAPYSPDLAPCDFFCFPKLKPTSKAKDLKT